MVVLARLAVAVMVKVDRTLASPSTVTFPLASTVATEVELLVQVTKVDKSVLVPSTNPLAVTLNVAPGITVVELALEEMLMVPGRLLAAARMVADPVTSPEGALTVTVPAAFAVTAPELTLTTVEESGVVDQVAVLVTSAVVPPTVVVEAVKFAVSPFFNSMVVGVTVSEAIELFETQKSLQDVHVRKTAITASNRITRLRQGMSLSTSNIVLLFGWDE